MTTLPHPDPTDNDPRVLDGERLFLLVLLASPTGEATLTQATPAEFQEKPFPGGGKWRGSIPRRLAGRGIVGAVLTPDGRPAAHHSGRKARKHGIACVWRLLDRDAGQRRLTFLDDYFRRHPRGVHRRPGLFDHLDDPSVGPSDPTDPFAV